MDNVQITQLQLVETSCNEMIQLNIKKDGYQTNIDVAIGPTHNCQLSAISPFRNLLMGSTFTNEEILYIIRDIKSNYKLREIILIDINEPLLNRVKELFGDRIINEMKYLSTNNSNMTIVLIKTKEI